MEWVAGMQKAVDYIEEHLMEKLDYEEIARVCFSSSFHFQRMFSLLCGYTLGEYIRSRRLTLAGAELAGGGVRVIDTAYKYGYDSPESFSKAFQKFHGVSPSQVRGGGVQLKSFSRLHLKIALEGGTTMNYKVEQKPEMTLIGYKRRFTGAPYGEARFEQEKNFFISTRACQWMLAGMTDDKLSQYCVLTSMDDDGYDFYTAATTNDYTRRNMYDPAVTGIDFMEKFGFEVLTIPARTYAVFTTQVQPQPIPEYMELRKQIAAEWLNSTEYQLADAPELSVYHWGIEDGCRERTVEIWMPITEKEE